MRPVLATCCLLAVLTLVRADTVLDPLGPVEPSAQEQLGIYELNLARHDPSAYGDRIGVSLSSVDPRPPLAVNKSLTGSARFHSLDMFTNEYFAHVSPVLGIAANQMAVDHGYDLFGDGLDHDWGTQNYIESLAWAYNSVPSFADAIAGLIEDQGVPGQGHRQHLLATSPFFEDHREVGCGRVSDGTEHYYTVHTGWARQSDLFLTGVVYDDRNQNGRYDLGEGVAGATITAGGATATSMSAGGYSLRVSPGIYAVTCSGGGFTGISVAEAQVGSHNVEVDFVSGWPAAVVDFSTLDPPAPLAVAIVADSHSGTAPHLVSFTGNSDGEDPAYTWDFGDGSSAEGAQVSHTFAGSGLYVVELRASDEASSGKALALVAVGGAGGAGAGTIPPSSTVLDVVKGKLNVDFARSGRDRIKVVAEIEMPEGFEPGSHPVSVAVAGVTLQLTLDEKNRARDAFGNRIQIRYRKPREGGGLPAGVRARLKISLKGDFRERLEAAGVRNETGSRSLADVPFAFLLQELPFPGAADLAVESTRGKKAKAITAAAR